MTIHRFLVGFSSLVLCAALAGGCSQTRKFQPTIDPNTLGDTQFIHYLGSVPVVSFSEACRAMVIAGEGTDSFENFSQRYDYLQQKGVVRDCWHVNPDDVLNLGTLSFMASKTCELPESVCTVLFGSWGLGDRRYALRQTAYYDIVCYNSPCKIVSGGEMLITLAHMDEYMAKKGLYDFNAEDVNSPAQFVSNRQD